MKRTTRRILALLLCCVMAASLAACGTTNNGTSPAPSASPSASGDQGSSAPSAESSAPTKDTLTIGVTGDTGTLDTVSVNGAGFLQVATCYSEPLYYYDGDGNIDWRLATSIDTVSDTEYVIHFREGVKFSNGNPFTADDFIFTLKTFQASSAGGLYLAGIDMEKTAKVDDYSAKLIYTSFANGQMKKLISMNMLDAESYNPDTASSNPIGTGPYVVEKYVVNSEVDLTARDDYWGGPVPIKHVIYKVINEDAQKTTAVETGQIDLLLGCPTSDAAYLDSLDGYSAQVVSEAFNMGVVFNMTDNSIFKNKDARYAAAYAIDKQSICKVAFDGYATPAVAPVSAFNSDWKEEYINLNDTYSHGYDLDKAKQLVDASGLAGSEVVIMTSGSTFYNLTAQVMMDSLKQVGITATIINFDQASIFTALDDTTQWDIYLQYTASPTDLGLDILTGYLSFGNSGEWAGPDYDQFMQLGLEAMVNPDKAKYAETYKQVLQIFEDSCAWYGVCDMQSIRVASDNLKGLETANTGGVFLQTGKLHW